MRRRLRILAMVAASVLTFAEVEGVSAQGILMPGMIDMMPSMQAGVNNEVNREMMEQVNGRPGSGNSRAAAARRAEINRVQSIGAAKIAAGNATTIFVPSVTGTQTLVKNLSFDQTAPQDAAGQVRWIQRYVKQSNQLAAQNGFAINDSADGYAFAYALSAAAYNNRDLDREQVERLRRDTQQMLLKHPYYQGLTDVDRQYTYEMNASLAAQAAEQRALYRRATTEAERQKYDERAKFFAKFVLDTKKD